MKAIIIVIKKEHRTINYSEDRFDPNANFVKIPRMYEKSRLASTHVTSLTPTYVSILFML